MNNNKEAAKKNYWFVGAVIDDVDQVERFLREGIWETNFNDNHNYVAAMQPGDHIALKSSYTRKNNLPFENNDKFVSVMGLKAIGKITENLKDNKRVKVEWNQLKPEREWYFYTSRQTVWLVQPDNELSNMLIDFAFNKELQDYDFFLNNPYWQEKYHSEELKDAQSQPMGCTKHTGLTMSATNEILYGPPGTGKTFHINKLKDKFTTQQNQVPYDQWLSEELKDTIWFEVMFMCLYDLGQKNVKVGDIKRHPFFIQKAKATGLELHLNQRVWSTLQSHTVESSETVKYKARNAPFVFDKKEDSSWFLAGDWQEECEELIERAKSLRKGPSSQAVQRHYRFITFHQAYSYEDFIEGIRPVTTGDSDQLSYEITPGVFKQICIDAKNAPQTQFAIFIDEINRGNIAKVFGELITLIELDKRAVYDTEGLLVKGMELTLPYSKERFGVPSNLSIYGTMNTADRSIALLDTALRRRFTFKEVMPNPELIEGANGNGLIDDNEGGTIDLRALLQAMNNRIQFLLHRDLTLGHAYFFKVKTFSDLQTVFTQQLIPLLQEYFYNDWHRIQLVFNDVREDNHAVTPQIIQHKVVSAETVLGFAHQDFEDQIEYSVAEPSEITAQAISKIYQARG